MKTVKVLNIIGTSLQKCMCNLIEASQVISSHYYFTDRFGMVSLFWWSRILQNTFLWLGFYYDPWHVINVTVWLYLSLWLCNSLSLLPSRKSLNYCYNHKKHKRKLLIVIMQLLPEPSIVLLLIIMSSSMYCEQLMLVQACLPKINVQSEPDPLAHWT